MTKIFQKVTDMKLSRRDFLKGSMAATGAIAALSLTGCQRSDLKESSSAAGSSAADPSTEAPV